MTDERTRQIFERARAVLSRGERFEEFGYSPEAETAEVAMVQPSDDAPAFPSSDWSVPQRRSRTSRETVNRQTTDADIAALRRELFSYVDNMVDLLRKEVFDALESLADEAGGSDGELTARLDALERKQHDSDNVTHIKAKRDVGSNAA